MRFKLYTTSLSNIDGMKYSLRCKIKVAFGHKLCYKIKVTFGEISLKLCQTHWNVAKNNVNVVVDELPSQLIVYTCLTIDIELDGVDAHQCGFMRFGAICPKWRASSEIGTKLKVIDFTMDTPSSLESA
jgi:hypothetical protein